MYDKDYENFIARMGSFDDSLDLEDNEDLKHYGIMGMKWGKKSNTQAVPERRMSNKELAARVKRLRMEEDFDKLSKSTAPTVTSAVDKLSKTLGTITVMTSAAVTLYNNIDKISKIVNKVT